MAIRIKNFEPGEGLWWRRLWEREGLACLELVGPDNDRYRPYSAALETIERTIGLPQVSLLKMIEKMRPDTKEEFFLKSYLSIVVPGDQVEGENFLE